jgi:hypothetical protein
VVVHQEAFGVGLELVAEQRRHAELLHQRHGELVEGVGQDDDLEVLAQGVEEIRAPGIGPMLAITFWMSGRPSLFA